jgi:hypothetical protein
MGGRSRRPRSRPLDMGRDGDRQADHRPRQAASHRLGFEEDEIAALRDLDDRLGHALTVDELGRVIV